MARTSTYLNFDGATEQAFEFYRAAFGGNFNGPVHRFSDMPTMTGEQPFPEAMKHYILHIELVILGGHVLMGTDSPERPGFRLSQGNNVHINLEPDTRAEADRLFAALSAGGEVEMPMQEMFWGAYYGNFRDRFGVQWMVNCAN